MGLVLIHVTMSLDGFIAKPDALDIEWMFKYGGDEETAQRVMGQIGAVILGNKDFREGLVTEDALPYGGMQVPQFVATHHAREPLTIGPLTFTFVTGGIEEVVALAKAAAGNKRVAILGASIAQQCLKAGLVDEIVLSLVPVLLGDGTSLFDRLGKEIELTLEEVVRGGQATTHRFSVIR